MFHVKDAEFNPTGRQGVYSGYAPLGGARRAVPLARRRAGRFRRGLLQARRLRLRRLGGGRMGMRAEASRGRRARGRGVREAPHHPRHREGLRRLRRRRHRRRRRTAACSGSGDAMKAGFCLLLWTTHVTEAAPAAARRHQGGGLRRRRDPDVRGRRRSTTRWLGGGSPTRGWRRPRSGVMPDDAHNPISADAAARRGGRRRTSTGWSTAPTALGAEVLCGPFHQPLGVFSGRGPTEEELGAAGRGAPGDGRPARRTLTLAIEPLNRFECYVLNTAAQAAAHVRGGGPAELRLSLRHLPRQHRGARPGRRRSARRSARSATSTSPRTTAARRAAGTSTIAAAIRAAEGGRLRRLVHRRGLRAGAAGPRGGDAGLAAAVRRARTRWWHGGRPGDPRRLGELTRDEGGTR